MSSPVERFARPILRLYGRLCLFDALLCEAVGRLIGGNVFMPGNLINAENGVVNVVYFAEGMLSIPSQKFDRAVGDSSGIGSIVGGVEDVSFFQRVTVALLQQLVVCAANHHLYLKLRNRLVIEDSAECA